MSMNPLGYYEKSYRLMMLSVAKHNTCHITSHASRLLQFSR